MIGPATYRPREEVDLQAWQVPTDLEDLRLLAEWVKDHGYKVSVTHIPDLAGGATAAWIHVEAHDGSMAKVVAGDWVVLGCTGSFFKCEDEYFQTNYVKTATPAEPVLAPAA